MSRPESRTSRTRIRRLGRTFLGGGLAWSIGLCHGSSPFSLTEHDGNPILSARDVTDRAARYVADPFLAFDQGRWHMFFEVLLDGKIPKGVIGLATSLDAVHWTYAGIVLEEAFHLSYPYVFTSQDRHYMVPESREAGEVRLYRAERFPRDWRYCATLIRKPLADASLFQHDGRWWLLAEDADPRCSLVLYSASGLEDGWTEHPQSPVIIGDPRLGRPAGRVIIDGDRIYRFAQDRVPHYGTRVHGLEITELTQERYEEELRAKGFLEGTAGRWNAFGMHHIDLQELRDGEWIAAVDGRCREYSLLHRWRLPACTHSLLGCLHPRLARRREHGS